MAKQEKRSRKADALEAARAIPDMSDEHEPVSAKASAGSETLADDQPEGEWVQEVESSYLQSKYTWVSVAAKRARELLEGSKPRVESVSDKPVTVALEELAQGKLYFERVQEGRR